MASYGPIYEFAFDSQNGADILIVISKKDYTGDVERRPLGRAPILKRENNGVIYGTSLELYAECKVDGEYAEFYTSSADEFKVDVWKDEVIIWTGFITPELYSEPDIAPPYDVQIIATDGIGELKNFIFETGGRRSIYEHLRQMLDHVELARGLSLISSLTFGDDAVQSNSKGLFNIIVDLSHEIGKSCYDVIQRLLTSFNAKITLYRNEWVIFRETDFIRMVYGNELIGVHSNGQQASFIITSFGSMEETSWWPIGQMTSIIEPAKKSLTLTAPNNYKDNAFESNKWISGNAATYNAAEGAYVLPDEGSYIMQELDFSNDVGYRLALRVSARNVGGPDSDLDVGIRVKIDALGPSGYTDNWLVPVEDLTGDKVIGYGWDNQEGWIKGELAIPMASDTSSDAQDIDIVIPLYDNRLQGVNTTSWIYARSIEVTIFNPSGAHDIYVYGVSLQPYESVEGYQANVSIDNGARETANEVTFSLSEGSKAMPAAINFMTGLPLLPGSNSPIKWWGGQNQDYLSAMAEDYAMAVALPRMVFKGTLNVPRRILPFLLQRDNTLYFPRTYSYNLLDDELEIDMISIPSADVILHSVSITAIAGSRNGKSSGPSGSGSGGSFSVNILNNWDAYDPTANQVLGANLGVDLYEWIEWIVGEGWGDSIDDIYDELNYIYEDINELDGRVAALEKNPGGGGSIVYEGITGISVNGRTYEDTDDDNVIVLPDYPTTVAELTDSADYATVAELEAINDDIADLAERVGDVEDSITTLGSRIGDAEDDIVVLDGKVGDAEGKIAALESQDEIITGIIEYISDDIAGIDSRLGVAENDILALQAEDERLAGLIKAINTIAGMFSWDDEEHTRIRTDFDFFSKKTISSGGKAAPSGEGGGGSIDLSDYATIDYVDSNFLSLAGGHVEDVLSADEFYTAGDATVEGTLYADGKIAACNIDVQDIAIDGIIELDSGSAIITGGITAEEFMVWGHVALDSVTVASLDCTDELYATYVEIDTLLVFEGGIILGSSSIYGDSGTITIYCQELDVTGHIRSETIYDIYDRLDVIEARLGI